MQLRDRFAAPARLQYGAICYRASETTDGEIEILLITSRETGRWVIPKGWPMKKRKECAVAAREAFEEAGVRGSVGDVPVGRFSYRKVMKDGAAVRCVVQVYPLRVTALEEDFPERDQRTLSWFKPTDAAERVAEPQLRSLIRAFRP